MSLPEYAERHGISRVFGAYAAHGELSAEGSRRLAGTDAPHVVFHRLLLVEQSSAETLCGGSPLTLDLGRLLVLPPTVAFSVERVSRDFRGELLCVDANLGDFACHKLGADALVELRDIFHITEELIARNHIYNTEMVKSIVNVLRLFLAEIPYEGRERTRDLRHKKDIYETFVYMAKRNFRSERGMRFYADKLNITTAYLSRTVKEMSGSTVNEYLTSMVYNEICNMLMHTDLPMSEIALKLHFSDQSALSNFFKQRAGMSPLNYRNRE